MHGTSLSHAHPDSLAGRADFTLGDVLFQPSSREIDGPGGSMAVEPRVMLLLAALADAEGSVVTRRQIEQICWGGIASDDSINQAAAAARKALSAVGSTLRLETIPRSGYRLRPDPAGPSNPRHPASKAQSTIQRRALLAAGLAVGAGAAGWLVWQRRRPAQPPGLTPLLAQVEQAWRAGMPESDAQALGFADAAVKLAPESAAAWGWKALMERNAFEYAPAEKAAALLQAFETSASRALRLDSQEGNARTAQATIGPLFGHWTEVRAGLNKVLDDSPDHPRALDHMGLVEMSIGNIEAAAEIGERLVDADPLAAVHQHKHIYRLWATGRLADMDRIADRALRLWPLHPAVFLARMWTLAFTERVAAARALLASAPAEKLLPQRMIRLFDATFAAFGDAALRPAAIEANLSLASRGPGGAIPAFNHLAALGATEEAHAVAEAFLLARGRLAPPPRSSAGLAANEMHGRKTIMLFLPTARPLHADSRFAQLLSDTGIRNARAAIGLPPDFRP